MHPTNLPQQLECFGLCPVDCEEGSDARFRCVVSKQDSPPQHFFQRHCHGPCRQYITVPVQARCHGSQATFPSFRICFEKHARLISDLKAELNPQTQFPNKFTINIAGSNAPATVHKEKNPIKAWRQGSQARLQSKDIHTVPKNGAKKVRSKFIPTRFPSRFQARFPSKVPKRPKKVCNHLVHAMFATSQDKSSQILMYLNVSSVCQIEAEELFFRL